MKLIVLEGSKDKGMDKPAEVVQSEQLNELKREVYKHMADIERAFVSLEQVVFTLKKDLKRTNRHVKKILDSQGVVSWMVDHYFGLEEQVRMLKFPKSHDSLDDQPLRESCPICANKGWVVDYSVPSWKSPCPECRRRNCS